MANAFAQEIENIMTSRSHYHKITSLVKNRTVLISELKDALVPFLFMLVVCLGLFFDELRKKRTLYFKESNKLIDQGMYIT
jgi:hypothetical protein